MFDLIELGNSTYYVDFPSKIGIYKTQGDKVYLIDSGNDKAIARRVLKMLNSRGWKLEAIFNTHCHADHVGGNSFLQENTGCKVYVPDIDCGSVNFPILNPVMLCGAYPAKELMGRFYMADGCVAEPLSSAVLPEGLEWFPLLGHTMGMVGFKTPDKVCFIADSVASSDVLQKYTVTYIISIGDYLKTLNYLETLGDTVFVPSHCEVTRDIASLTALNRSCVEKILQEITELCKTPQLPDDITKHFFDNNQLVFNVMQHSLIGSTVRSYLSYLQSLGRVEAVCIENRVYWQAISV